MREEYFGFNFLKVFRKVQKILMDPCRNVIFITLIQNSCNIISRFEPAVLQGVLCMVLFYRLFLDIWSVLFVSLLNTGFP